MSAVGHKAGIDSDDERPDLLCTKDVGLRVASFFVLASSSMSSANSLEAAAKKRCQQPDKQKPEKHARDDQAQSVVHAMRPDGFIKPP